MEFDEKDTILSVIDSFEDAKDNESKLKCYLLDKELGIFAADFVSYNTYIDKENGCQVYRCFFTVKLDEQVSVAKYKKSCYK